MGRHTSLSELGMMADDSAVRTDRSARDIDDAVQAAGAIRYGSTYI